MTTTGDMDRSFVMAGSGSNAGNDSFGDKLGQEDGDGDINLLDNLLVDENNPQIESDKQRQQLISQKKVIVRGHGVRMPSRKEGDNKRQFTVEGQ